MIKKAERPFGGYERELRAGEQIDRKEHPGLFRTFRMGHVEAVFIESVPWRKYSK